MNGDAFNDTFNQPSQTLIGTIVSIYNSGLDVRSTRMGEETLLLLSVSMVVGCFLGAVTTSIIGENLGRRKSIAIGVVIMIIGSLLQSTAFTRAHIIVARIVSGCGMGFINSTVPVYQSEFSPKANRGLYVCMQLSTLNFGTDLVYWIDYAFSTRASSYAWRIPVILQCVFLFPMLFIISILPESPRWLAAHNRSDESLSVLRRLRGHTLDDEAIVRLHGDIVRAVEEEAAMNAGSWRTILKADKIHSRRRLLIACSIQAFQQLGGINAIIYYSSTLFKNVGFSNHLSALMSGFLQLWFFVASFIPWILIDRIGRRPLLLSMITVMALVMAAQAALVYQVQFTTSVAYTAGIAGAVMLFLFEGAFTIGFQATVWVYPSEILPLRLRQKGSSISTAANWICNFLIVQITPPAIENVGWRTYVIFAVLNVSRSWRWRVRPLGLRSCSRFGNMLMSCSQATWVPIIYMFFPESKGRELEDFDRLFAGEEDAAITERVACDGNAECLKGGDSVTVEGGAACEEKGLKGLI